MKLLTITSILMLSISCTKDEWIGLVYPDKNNLYDFKIIGTYQDLNSCLKEGNRVAGSFGSYECGLNCDTNKSPMVCKRTVGNEK